MTDTEKIAMLEKKLKSANSYIRWLDKEYKTLYNKMKTVGDQNY